MRNRRACTFVLAAFVLGAGAARSQEPVEPEAVADLVEGVQGAASDLRGADGKASTEQSGNGSEQSARPATAFSDQPVSPSTPQDMVETAILVSKRFGPTRANPDNQMEIEGFENYIGGYVDLLTPRNLVFSNLWHDPPVKSRTFSSLQKAPVGEAGLPGVSELLDFSMRSPLADCRGAACLPGVGSEFTEKAEPGTTASRNERAGRRSGGNLGSEAKNTAAYQASAPRLEFKSESKLLTFLEWISAEAKRPRTIFLIVLAFAVLSLLSKARQSASPR